MRKTFLSWAINFDLKCVIGLIQRRMLSKAPLSLNCAGKSLSMRGKELTVKISGTQLHRFLLLSVPYEEAYVWRLPIENNSNLNSCQMTSKACKQPITFEKWLASESYVCHTNLSFKSSTTRDLITELLTYVCPVSWAMINDDVNPSSSFKVQLRNR